MNRRDFIFAALAIPLIPSFAKAQSGFRSAVRYLTSHPLDEWGVMALVAADATTSVNNDFLRGTLAERSSIACSKRVLAIASIGENPHTFGDEDFVEVLKGLPLAGIRDTIWALLALAATGESNSPEAQANKGEILLSQQVAGGWSCCVGAPAEAPTTALAVMALIAAGLSRRNQTTLRAMQFLESQRLSNGAYSFDGSPDTVATAWTASTRTALGLTSDSVTTQFLWSMQAPDGSFRLTPETRQGDSLTTAHTVVALAHRAYPVLPSTKRLSVRIEDLFDGSILFPFFPTPLQAIREAGFFPQTASYGKETLVTGIGPYVMGGRGTGWLYFVNGGWQGKSADSYLLQPGNRLEWIFR